MSASSTAVPATYLGRFELRERLGESAGAVVWRAHDPRAQQDVTLKLPTLQGEVDPNQLARWLAQARNQARLAHPRILPVLEADLVGTQPCLVRAFVPGQTLDQRLAAKGALPARKAVSLCCDVLDALVAAHALRAWHQDLRASNVLVDSGERAVVMDFALPPLPGAAEPCLSPEVAQGQPATAAGDVFATGLLLVQMLTGTPLLDMADADQTRYRLVHEQLAVPEALGPDADGGLRAILRQALSRDPAQRQPGAQALRDDLQQWLDKPAGHFNAAQDETDEDGADSENAVLQALLKRMRHKSDFPAMSDAVVRIQELTSSESESIGSITNEILKDVALTNKLLRLVNSAHYARAGDGIRTVSRAVSLVGLNGIRNLSLSLVLLEHMRDRSHADLLKEEFLRCLMAGVVGGELCPVAHEVEEAFIISMFQNLGRLLTGFYFPEEARNIRGLMSGTPPMAEEAAATSVLGLGFEELGAGVARSWALPESIQHALHKPLGAPPGHLPPEPAERQRWLAFVANGIADLVLRSDPRELEHHQEQFTSRHAKVLGLKPADVTKAVHAARAKFIDMVAAMQLQVAPGSPAARMLLAPGEFGAAGKKPLPPKPADSLAALELQAVKAPVDSASQDASARRMQILAAGIQDITQVLVEEHKLNDVLRMILETMLRALHLRYLVFCMRDPKTETLTGRFGLGSGVERVVRQFSIPIRPGTTDFLGSVCVRGLDTLINDAHEPRVADRLPPWFQQQVQASSFLLLPLQMQGRPFGLIYGDLAQKNSLRLDERELALLRTLRNQAVMAFRK